MAAMFALKLYSKWLDGWRDTNSLHSAGFISGLNDESDLHMYVPFQHCFVLDVPSSPVRVQSKVCVFLKSVNVYIRIYTTQSLHVQQLDNLVLYTACSN